jgi:hypothetical protein
MRRNSGEIRDRASRAPLRPRDRILDRVPQARGGEIAGRPIADAALLDHRDHRADVFAECDGLRNVLPYVEDLAPFAHEAEGAELDGRGDLTKSFTQIGVQNTPPCLSLARVAARPGMMYDPGGPPESGRKRVEDTTRWGQAEVPVSDLAQAL